MNSHDLQRKIQGGDRDAFRELYAVCGQGVYLQAQEALGDSDAARDTVKQVFLNLHHEILSSEHPLDIDARLATLTDAELRTRRILKGDLSAADGAVGAPPEPVVSQAAAASASPAPDPFAAAEPYRPPLERAQARMDADKAAETLDAVRKKRASCEPHEPKKRGDTVVTVLIVIFLLLFVWVLVGILMDLSVLPRIDLGYQWFNDTVFPLFNLAS